jgi:hypothetical protein
LANLAEGKEKRASDPLAGVEGAICVPVGLMVQVDGAVKVRVKW